VTLKGISLFAVALAACVLGGGEAEAALPDLLCKEEAKPTSYPSNEALQQAAASTETLLARGRAAGDVFVEAAALLEVPAANPAPPSAEARAAYCVAAGEVMRVGSQGSQFQAQSYLISAFRAAQEAQSQLVGSRAAYRLGLVSQAAPAVAGTRGGGGKSRSASTREVAAEAQQVEQTASTSQDPCAGLASPNVMTRSNGYITTLSFKCAAARARAAGQADLAALAGLRLARLGLQFLEASPESGERIRAKAVENALEGLDVARAVSVPSLRAELIGRLASVAIDLGETAEPLVRQAPAMMREADGANSGTRAYAAAIEGRLALAASRPPAAANLFRQAILLESQRPLPARLPQWHLLLGQAEPANRTAHVTAAYQALGAIRPLLPRTDPLTDEAAFSLYMRGVFESAADVQLASASGDRELPAIRAAQEIVETYRQAELQSVFGSECVPAREPLRPQELRAGEVVLYPILLPDRVELLYAVGGGNGYKRLPANRNADRTRVSQLVEQMVLSMSVGEDDGWRAPAQALYDLLIKPIEGELGPNSLLAIIPDGPLRAVPFAALLSSDGRFLVQRTRLSIAPSLAYSQPGSGRGEDGLSVIAASLQKEVEVPAGYFSKLEGTAAEAQIAAGTARDSQLIRDFSKADLVRALTGTSVDILHLATHASFNGRSDRAFIVADGEVIMLSELRGLIAQNRTRGEQLDLLVLSACETAVGDDEASMGLAGAAVQAGAQSAIASLWQVNDAGTAELMRNFYDRFRAGRSKSEAIREAQLALLEAGGNNANPNIWAAFTLLGAWR
jgi:CHAT domain-containing protein